MLDRTIFPYLLRTDDGVTRQQHSFYDNPLCNLSDYSGISRDIMWLEKENEDDMFKRVSGIVGEILAMRFIDDSFGRYFNLSGGSLEGKVIGGRQGFIINSSEPYIAKLDGGSRVYILRKESDEERDERFEKIVNRTGSYEDAIKLYQKLHNDSKFGFVNISELDGLYMVKTKDKIGRKKRKYIMPVEVKTGSIRLTPEHILNDVVTPIMEMWRADKVGYVLVDFKENIYSDSNENILNKYMYGLKSSLEDYGVDFIPIHFPFSRSDFKSYIRNIVEDITGKYKGTCIYNQESGEVEMLIQGLGGGLPIKGRFIPD